MALFPHGEKLHGNPACRITRIYTNSVLLALKGCRGTMLRGGRIAIVFVCWLVPSAKTRRRSGLSCNEVGKVLVKDVCCFGKDPSLTMLRDNLPEPVFSVKEKSDLFIVVWAYLNFVSPGGGIWALLGPAIHLGRLTLSDGMDANCMLKGGGRARDFGLGGLPALVKNRLAMHNRPTLFALVSKSEERQHASQPPTGNAETGPGCPRWV